MYRRLAYILLISLIVSCEDSRPVLPSVEERVAASTEALLEELTDPTFGWRVDYKPTANAGTFLVLLNFDENGTVRIQSDVPDQGGIYLDQTISYRIDQELDTELVLETYAVFHYLFEQNQNSFGAEFEFIFEEEDDGNLIFSSKSDFGFPTQLVFQPAGATDSNLISTEIIAQLTEGNNGLIPVPMYQVFLPANNVSVFTSFDLENRRAKVHGAALGQTFAELLSSSEVTAVEQLTDISFLSEEVLFDDPISFSIGGNNYTISSFAADNFQVRDTSYCSGDDATFASLDATFSSLGTAEMRSTLFTTQSSFFDEETEFYSHSDVFVYDENEESIQEEVRTAFPNSQFFVMVYNGIPRGFDDGTFTGLGWVGFDETNTVEFFLREINVTNATGNLLEFELTDGTFITVADSLDERDALFQLTDRVFEGGTLFGTEILSVDGLFEIYNPCNEYRIFQFE